jgi:hypothetical protein
VRKPRANRGSWRARNGYPVVPTVLAIAQNPPGQASAAAPTHLTRDLRSMRIDGEAQSYHRDAGDHYEHEEWDVDGIGVCHFRASLCLLGIRKPALDRHGGGSPGAVFFCRMHSALARQQ